MDAFERDFNFVIFHYQDTNTKVTVFLSKMYQLMESRHFLIPWTGGAFAPLGPILCPTTEKKNGLLPQSQGPRTCIE
jgi:hypothetical protein